MSESGQTCGRCGAPRGDSLRGGICVACRLEAILPPEGEFSTSPAKEPALGADVATVQRFGPYELLEEVGRGGMGVIYKARQPGLDRVVALKMLLAGEFADAKARERLLREAKIAARLTHPGIVTIHEVGEHQGRPYFAMEFVPGRNLAQHCRDGLLPLATAVRYVEQLARAVHYAHQHGVIHRDLKPANVLISPDDEPKLTDFGLTKSLVDPTQTVESAGSPNFMAPEQADSALGTTGTPTDIYGLGAILFYLLTGRPPAVGESLSETLRNVMTGEPVAPRQLRPALPKDLETITLRCLEKEPSRRYGNALDVAEELNRWQRHEPIHARPATRLERLAKWVRRHPVVAASGVAVGLSLLGGLAATSWQWQRAEAQMEETARANYAATLGVIRQRLDEGNYLTARTLLLAQPERFRNWEWGRFLQLAHPEVMVSGVLTNGWHGYLDAQPKPPTSFGQTVSADHKWAACWGSGRFEVFALSNQASVFHLGSATNRVSEATFSPSGDRLAMAGPGPGFTLWRSGDWIPLRRWGTNQLSSTGIRFNPQGTRLVTADGSDVVRIVDATSGAEVTTLRGGIGTYHSAWFNPTGNRVVGVFQRGIFQRYTLWDAETGKVAAEVPAEGAELPSPGQLRSVRLTADTDHYVTITDPGVASLWRIGEGQPLFQSPPAGEELVWAGAMPSESRLVTMGFPSKQARFYDLKSGTLLPASGERFNRPEVGVDGKTLISCEDSHVLLWNWNTGQPRAKFGIGDAAIHARCDVTPDGRLLSALIGRFPVASILHVWPATGADRRLQPTNTALRASLAPDGGRVALAHLDSRISLWDSHSGACIGWLEGHFRQVNDLVWAETGKTLFSASGDHTVRRWNVAARRPEATYSHLNRPIWALAATGDGRRVAAADLSGRVIIWDSRSGEPVRQWDIPRENDLLPIQSICLSPDGQQMVALGFSAAGVWSVDSGHRLFRFNPPGTLSNYDPVQAGFSVDGQKLVTADRSGRVRLWNTADWGQVRNGGTSASAASLPFSADGSRIFLSTSQMISAFLGQVSVEVLDGETGSPIVRMDRHHGWGSSLAFHSPSRRLMHLVLNSSSPAYGAEIMQALPWRDRDFPGAPGEPLESRVIRLARAEHWRRIHAPVVASVAPATRSEPRSNWPSRNPATPIHCVDLSAAYNGHLETGWAPEEFLEEYGNDLAALPQGTVRLDGVDWDIRGVVATGRPSEHPLHPSDLARTVSGIPVHGIARRLHFLHAAIGPLSNGASIGSYRLHFDDGTTAEQGLVAGDQIGDWWTRRPGSSCRQASVAWEGDNPAAKRLDSKVRLFHWVWENPYPERSIVALDFTAKHRWASPFVVAITREP